MTKRPAPCHCERLHFPHRRTVECEDYEHEQSLLAAEYEQEQWNAWAADRAADANAINSGR